ncbi:MAG: hypothetical protein AB2693_33550, partial [Candidatus Thiodiazotropha sp.]
DYKCACRYLRIVSFLSNFWGLATLKKLNTETRVCRTKLGMATFIFEPLGRYHCWWTICS